MRLDNRKNDELRPVTIVRDFHSNAPGSVLISAGNTVILCTASITEGLPPWMPKDSEKGWLTAEYRMLPGSTVPRSARKDRPDGRATEIQRLIGRSLRAIIDLEKIPLKTIYLDCDVIKADGGTRTLSVTGAFIALVDALRIVELPESPLIDTVAAVSVGLLGEEAYLDLCYTEDVEARVDMNLVMTGSGKFIEIQGTGEESTYTAEELQMLLNYGQKGIRELTELQQKTLKT